MQRILCETTAQFAACLEQAESVADDGIQMYIYFTGAKNPETGLSWCGDCTRAEPLVNKILSSIEGGCVFLEVPVVRDEYRNSEFVFRTDPRFQLRCVPTLIKWVRGKALGRLDDSQSQNEDLIAELVDA